MPPTTPTSNKKPLLIIVAVAVILLIAAGVTFWVMRHHKNTPAETTGRQAVIQVDAAGFTPATLTIKLGTTVVWKNTDTSPRVVASNPYPTDDSVPGLHSKDILPNGSYTYKPTEAGTINYHDEQSPTHNGTIVVTK